MMYSKDQIVQFAIRSLLYEAVTNPKPGLVDPQSQGAHTDMDIFTFVDSSTSLITYFDQAFIIGDEYSKTNLIEMFIQLRQAGIVAEGSMFTATNGVNTHKGAVFSLGVLITALAYSQKNVLTLEETVRQMLNGLVKNDFVKINNKIPEDLTAGEKQYLKYGITGIRGEAESGFPTVFNVALPFLKQTQGTKNERLLDTLMKIAQVTNDSNLIKRAKTTDILPWMRDKISEYFSMGGASTEDGMKFLYNLNKVFIDRNLSLGGSADLLILTIFVGMLEGTI